MQEADQSVINDSLAPLFTKQLTEYLTSELTFCNNLDSLEKEITILQSSDKKIKFYSWDELTGGSWHQINVFAQFRNAKKKIIYKRIDTDDEMMEGGYTDSYIYKINELKIGTMVNYLTFGWGTHGSGKEHVIIQLYKIEGDKLLPRKVFENRKTEYVYEYPRGESAILQFDKKDMAIKILQKEYNRRDQTNSPARLVRTLKFRNGHFR